MSRPASKKGLYVLSIFIAVVAVMGTIRFSGVSLSLAENFAARLSFKDFILLMPISAVFILINAERWLFIYNASHLAPNERIKRPFSIGSMAFSHVLVHFLPIQVAALTARLLALRVMGTSGWKSVVGTTLVEQTVDLALVLCAAASFSAFLLSGNQVSVYFITLSVSVSFTVVLGSFSGRPCAVFLSRFSRHAGWGRRLADLGNRLLAMSLVQPVIIFKICLFSIFRLCAYAALYYAVAVFLGLGAYAFYIPLVMPVVQLANIFPLAPGNIGILEGVLLALLLALGIPADIAGPFALLARAIVFCVNLCLLPLILCGLRLCRR